MLQATQCFPDWSRESICLWLRFVFCILFLLHPIDNTLAVQHQLLLKTESLDNAILAF